MKVIPHNALYFIINKRTIKLLSLCQVSWFYAYRNYEEFKYGYKHICVVDQPFINTFNIVKQKYLKEQ